MPLVQPFALHLVTTNPFHHGEGPLTTHRKAYMVSCGAPPGLRTMDRRGREFLVSATADDRPWAVSFLDLCVCDV